jgi:hypothetical protein
MFATLSLENRAVPLLRDLGISNAFTSVLVGIEETKLSRALRLLKPLSNDEGLRLIQTLQRLIELRDALRPMCLDLRDPVNTRRVLDAFEGMDSTQLRERVSELFTNLRSEDAATRLRR